MTRRRMMSLAAALPLLVTRQCGCGGVMPGDVEYLGNSAGEFQGCSYEMQFGVATGQAFSQIRETAGSCTGLSAEVTGSGGLSGVQRWPDPETGRWLRVTAGGGELGGASFVLEAQGCVMELRYGAGGRPSDGSAICDEQGT